MREGRGKRREGEGLEIKGRMILYYYYYYYYYYDDDD